MNKVRFAKLLLAGPALLGVAGCAMGPHLPSGLLVEEQDQGKAVPPAGIAIRPVHPRGLELTKLSEGWVPRLYNDSAGYCTIGYGHLIKKARCNGTEPAEFLPGITMVRGTELLKDDMSGAQIVVATGVKVPLNDLQYSALTDFVFNVGGAAFRNSTLLKRLNAGQFDQVPVQLRRWTIAGGERPAGLVKRREREIELFFDGQAPKGVPRPDEDLAPIDIMVGEK